MTTPQSQCTNLELSKKLKELGYPQESLFYWSVPLIEKAVTKEQEDELKKCKTELYYLDNDWGEYFESISAPTVAELGEKLPRYIADPDQPLSGVKGKKYPLIIECLSDDYSSDKKINGWRIRYGDTKVKVDSEHELNSAGIYYVGTEADARAKMLIYLLENKLIEL